MSNFRDGNIVRIHLKNFLTYDEVDFRPEPYLNVVIGPNGTGKSSILCAICIGLGSKPEVTGRGKNLTEYIKHGKDEAVVEIELKHSKRNVMIRRSFNRSGCSSWKVNNELKSQKDVETLVRSMNVQIDNLCQFLPQDRVTEFAKLNKIQLLHNTETAIGEEDLSNQHKQLCEGGKNIKEMESRLQDLKKRIESEKSQNEQLKDQVDTIRMKRDLNKLIKKLTDQITYLKYNDGRRIYMERKNKLKEQRAKVKKFEEQMQPLRDELKHWTQRVDSHQSEPHDTETVHLMKKKASDANARINQSSEAIDTAKSEYKNYKEYCHKKLKEMEELKQQIESLRGHLSKLPEVNEIQVQQKLKELTHQVAVISNESSNIEEQRRENGMQLGNIKVSQKQTMKLLENSSNVWRKKLEILRHTERYQQRNANNQVYDAAIWLKQNKDKFRAPIHGPMFSVMNVSNPVHAQYVENTIPRRDLIAFVCEDKEDMNKFKKLANSNNWSINILHSGNTNAVYNPTVPIQHIRSAGFEMYIKDAIETVPAVMSYLCRTTNVHNTPFGKNVDSNRIPDNIRTYFKGADQYRRTKSRYDHQITESVTPIRPVNLLKIAADTQEVTQLNKKLDQINQNIVQLEENDQRLRDKLSQNKQAEESLRSEKQDLHNSLQQKKTMISKIDQLEDKLKRRKNVDLDLEGAKEKLKNCIKESGQIIIDAATEFRYARTNIGTWCQKNMLWSITKSFVEKKRDIAEEKLEAAMQELHVLKQTCRLAEESLAAAQAETRALLQELVASLELQNIKQMTEEVLLDRCTKKMMLEDCMVPPDVTVESLENELTERKAHMECIIAPDDDVFVKFNERQDLIAKLESDAVKQAATIANHGNNIDAIKTKWLPLIEKLTEKISSHFSSFMQKVGCAGEVSLDRGNNEDDFTQYGLSIKVKFRDTEKLKDLTAHQQSGGERSVSTALYLMALQTLTAVPFRCVDEINQGMDAQNERRMFTMLVNSTTTANASQYFLVTPKLLPNLPFNDRVNFVVVYNGPIVGSQKYLNTPAIVRQIAKKKKRDSRA